MKIIDPSINIQLAISPMLEINNSNLVVVLSGKFKETHGVFLMSYRRFMNAAKHITHFNAKYRAEIIKDQVCPKSAEKCVQELFDKHQGDIHWVLPTYTKIGQNMFVVPHISQLYQYTPENCETMRQIFALFNANVDEDCSTCHFQQERIDNFNQVLADFFFDFNG